MLKRYFWITGSPDLLVIAQDAAAALAVARRHADRPAIDIVSGTFPDSGDSRIVGMRARGTP